MKNDKFNGKQRLTEWLWQNSCAQNSCCRQTWSPVSIICNTLAVCTSSQLTTSVAKILPMNEQTYKTIVTKCWAEPDFKQRLIADPVAILLAEGVSVPDGVKVTVVENTASEFTFVIPPEAGELSDDALDGVSGGYRMSRTHPTIL
jgi:hypothetical protein